MLKRLEFPLVLAVAAFAILFALIGPVRPNLLALQATGGGPFNPASVPGLALWYDLSDSVFTNTGCTTTAGVGDSVLCIKDKGPNGCNATTTNTDWTLSTSGAVRRLESFTTIFPAFTVASACLSMFQNKGYGVVHAAVENSSDLTTSDAIMKADTSGAGNARFYCAINVGGVTGQGYGLRGRLTDAGAGQNLVVGSLNSARLVLRCHIAWAAATANIFVNNASAASSGSFLTAGNTENTASAAITVLEGFAGTFYGMIIETPVSAPSTTTMAQEDSFLCAQAGISVGGCP